MTSKSLEALLTDARHRIEVTPPELDEAKRRRELIGQALKDAFPGARVYVNGSVAHGDALTPLNDVDLGVIVPNADQGYGPGRKGPRELMDRAARTIRSELRAEFGDLRVEVEGRKRSILVKFNDAVTVGGKDFTADVVVAVDNPDGGGLFIPRFTAWDRSHPQKHTELVRQAITDTKVAYAHVNRILKHWNRVHGHPLCSWNIKALGLPCLTQPVAQLDGLVTWFEHAITELERELTPDPAGVADKPIKINEDMTRLQVVERLQSAQKQLTEAVALEKAGYPVLAHDELAQFFDDPKMCPGPAQGDVLSEEGRRLRASLAATGVVTGTGTGAHRPRIPVKSWAP